MIVKQIIWTLILSWCAFNITNAQSKYVLKIVNNDQTYRKENLPHLKIHGSDSTLFLQQITYFIEERRSDGYLTSSLDSLAVKKDTLYAYLTLGEKFKWVKLSQGNLSETFLKELGFHEKSYPNKAFSINEYKKLQNKIISISENNGHPFASVKLDSIEVDDSKISAAINFSPGPMINFDSLSISGSGKINPVFLEHYFNIRKGTPFQKKKITEAEKLMAEFPSIEVERPTEILYSNYKAYPIFFLNHRPANVIDGIIGFLPNEATKNRILLTGQFHLNLYNIGGTGKDLLMEWNKLKPLSQLLNGQFSNYNVLKTGLDLETKFNLLKEDTSFINIIGKVNISKALRNNLGRIRFFTELKNSRTGSVNNFIGRSDTLLADFNLISYGTGYQWHNLDNIMFPRKGFKFTIEAQIGNKTINRNSGMDSSFYASISKKTIQSAFTVSGQQHLKISRKIGWFGGVNGGMIINKQLFLNDMFRVGGLKTLRGFNENYFFASKYGLSNLEFRFFYEEESYFMVFYDQGYLTSEYLNNKKTEYPMGIGGGLNLKTNVGTLQIIYSLGKSKDQPLSFNYSKVHFGIISRF